MTPPGCPFIRLTLGCEVPRIWCDPFLDDPPAAGDDAPAPAPLCGGAPPSRVCSRARIGYSSERTPARANTLGWECTSMRTWLSW
jgi:hypothetical protein